MLYFYFTTSDLEAFSKKLKSHNVTFIHDIRLHDWGEKVIRVFDPDGHLLEIGDAHNNE
ncbi:VOC family protein [Lachnospiraceae bacterium MD1]|uniref:VOC family protein n=1 Tax=Variimorphobacter saccharofermentans TaxID=2755051 RepID=A0A839JWU1_9FIRM|nr:VOC family protein [Variimorphobacter saccharofermentans]